MRGIDVIPWLAAGPFELEVIEHYRPPRYQPESLEAKARREAAERARREAERVQRVAEAKARYALRKARKAARKRGER